jgi:GxxExxY protein
LNYEETKKLRVDPAIEEIATQIVDAAISVHRELGPGLLESVYQTCLKHELESRNLSVRSEVEIPIHFKDLNMECGFRADLIINNKVLIELKAVETLLPVHKAQLITYLKLADLPLGFLINFNVPLLKDGLHRFIHPNLLRSAP